MCIKNFILFLLNIYFIATILAITIPAITIHASNEHFSCLNFNIHSYSYFDHHFFSFGSGARAYYYTTRRTHSQFNPFFVLIKR